MIARRQQTAVRLVITWLLRVFEYVCMLFQCAHRECTHTHMWHEVYAFHISTNKIYYSNREHIAQRIFFVATQPLQRCLSARCALVAFN